MGNTCTGDAVEDFCQHRLNFRPLIVCEKCKQLNWEPEFFYVNPIDECGDYYRIIDRHGYYINDTRLDPDWGSRHIGKDYKCSNNHLVKRKENDHMYYW